MKNPHSCFCLQSSIFFTCFIYNGSFDDIRLAFRLSRFDIRSALALDLKNKMLIMFVISSDKVFCSRRPNFSGSNTFSGLTLNDAMLQFK